MRPQTRQVLDLFVLKADHLVSRNFVKHISAHGINFNIKFTAGQPVQTTLSIPDEESLEALMVTFRMFIQNNDSISFGNLGKLMDDPGLSENWKAQINDVRAGVNQRLNRGHPISISLYGDTPTAREVLDIFVYGDIAHTSDEKRQRFLKWKSEPTVFPLLQHVFHEIIIGLVSSIRYVATMTKKELAGEEVPRLPTDAERAEMAARREAEEDAERLEWLNS